MTLQEILKLREDEFKAHNTELWKAIDNLPLNELESLCNQNPWSDVEAITDELWETLAIKKEQKLTELIRQRFNKKERDLMRDVLLQDKDLTWDYVRHLFWEDE